MALMATVGVPAHSAITDTSKQISPNFRDAEITSVIEAVSLATGKNFIVDPRVKAQVTMLANSPMTPDELYQAFLAILQVHGFAAVPAGDQIKIVPDAGVRQFPGNDLPAEVSATSDDFVTQVVAVRNVSAAQLVPILRPLLPTYAHLAAYPSSNSLILSDRAANVSRLLRIIARLDAMGVGGVEVVQIASASASEIARIVNSVFQGQGGAESGSGPSAKLFADDRTNSIIVSGDATLRTHAKALIATLDHPTDSGETQVRYLRFADAEKVAVKLKEQALATAGAAVSASPAGATTSAADRVGTIWADPQTNALVITAPPKIMRMYMSIVDKLDIRRAQVLVEAILVEVSVDKSADLGVNWAVWAEQDGKVYPGGTFISDVGGSSIVDLYQLIDSGGSSGTIPTGTTLGIGRLVENGFNFAATLRAMRGDANTNVIATPSALTLDNQEATIKIAQQVPFLTGKYTSTGTGDSATNPFQTIERQDVGTILKVTPQINDGGTVLLKLSIENSSLSESSQAVDLITNKRTIDTEVLIEDGGIVVIGGLIGDQTSEGEQRVPWLGDIPILGHLFKTQSATRTKTNLMVFIRPRVMRDGIEAAVQTGAKYEFMRQQLDEARSGKHPPGLRGEHYPTLPPLDALVEVPSSSGGPEVTENTPADQPAP